MPGDDCERHYSRTLSAESAGLRLDRALADCLPEFSRARLQRWLAAGNLTVDGATLAARTRVRGGEMVELVVPVEPHETDVAPEDIPLEIIHADAAILVINKPAGMIMHPGAGHATGTVQNALVHYDPELAQLPRAGIVHRLDKDTTGLFVVARTHTAHQQLVAALAERRVTREYEALVRGTPTAGGRIDAPIGRHRVHRQRMAVTERGRSAVTHYRIVRRFHRHTLVRCFLESGRTHQIRVHLACVGLPIVGDPAYGRGTQPAGGYSEGAKYALRTASRQALHAKRLALCHPETGRDVEFEAPRPADMEGLINALAADTESTPES